MSDEKLVLSVSDVLFGRNLAVTEQRTQSISVTIIKNIVEAEIFFVRS